MPPTRMQQRGDVENETWDDPEGSNKSPSSIELSDGEGREDESGNELCNTDHYATLEKKRILKLFEYNPEDDVYTVKMKSVLKLTLVAKFVAIGVSFCQANKLYHCVKEGTSSVDSNFSLINWMRDPHSKSLTDFSLESILHCKQYQTLLESLSI